MRARKVRRKKCVNYILFRIFDNDYKTRQASSKCFICFEILVYFVNRARTTNSEPQHRVKNNLQLKKIVCARKGAEQVWVRFEKWWCGDGTSTGYFWKIWSVDRTGKGYFWKWWCVEGTGTGYFWKWWCVDGTVTDWHKIRTTVMDSELI